MTQDERLDYLLRYLLAERKEYTEIHVPDTLSEKRRLLRSLMNVRPPIPASEDFLNVQDAYLRERLAKRVLQSWPIWRRYNLDFISGRVILLPLPLMLL